jgi:hypothetical protein
MMALGMIFEVMCKSTYSGARPEAKVWLGCRRRIVS